jgi:hypothetical protein
MSLQHTPVVPSKDNAESAPETPGVPTLEISPNREAEIKAFGVSIRIPLPKWAVAPIATVLVLGLIGLGFYLSYAYAVNSVLVSRNQLNEYQENLKHSYEPSELKENQLVTFKDGTQVTVNHFKSDGCSQIVRYIPALSKADGLWMFGPKLTPDKQSRIGTYLEAGRTPLEAGVLAVPNLSPRAYSERRMTGPELTYAQYTPNPGNYKEVQGGRCWDPHPGPWSEKPEQTAQCAVQVWRYFNDGCIHFQWFNPCSGTWDVYPNGAPRVYWQRCIH